MRAILLTSKRIPSHASCLLGLCPNFRLGRQPLIRAQICEYRFRTLLVVRHGAAIDPGKAGDVFLTKL